MSKYIVMNLDDHYTPFHNPETGTMMVWDNKRDAELFAREQRIMSREKWVVAPIYPLPQPDGETK